MERYWPILGITSALAAALPHGAIRRVALGENQVVTIHTAVGFSTLIELPVKPSSVVIGDQDSFQIQYVGTAITIKPLIARAKSDLFIFTELGRYNCELISGPAEKADLLVGIEPLPPPKASEKGVPLKRTLMRHVTFHGFTVHLLSYAPIAPRSDPDASLEIEFELSSVRDKYLFSPSAIGVEQGGRFVAIQEVELDSLLLTPDDKPVHGKLTLQKSDLTAHLPITLVFAVPGKGPKTGKKTRGTGSNGAPVHRIHISIGSPFEDPKGSKRRNPFAG